MRGNTCLVSSLSRCHYPYLWEYNPSFPIKGVTGNLLMAIQSNNMLKSKRKIIDCQATESLIGVWVFQLSVFQCVLRQCLHRAAHTSFCSGEHKVWEHKAYQETLCMKIISQLLHRLSFGLLIINSFVISSVPGTIHATPWKTHLDLLTNEEKMANQVVV